VQRFFRLNLSWLQQTLELAAGSGAVSKTLIPARDAHMIMATLQGAMFVALGMGDTESFDQALEGLLMGLRKTAD